ncbi:hypothetical protein L6452_29768 [Arctium lappa]|uniref:Uncharacterized protein n=1 Tax=Arctium lappa TaxID=4217 RepID=A0ACB8ZHG2_ARCLA|nr:hypothetical protein L6452_29768 [Arctium lappa]
MGCYMHVNVILWWVGLCTTFFQGMVNWCMILEPNQFFIIVFIVSLPLKSNQIDSGNRLWKFMLLLVFRVCIEPNRFWKLIDVVLGLFSILEIDIDVVLNRF